MLAKQTLAGALRKILADLNLPWPDKLVIEEPKVASHGDLSTNAALLLARPSRLNPRELAQSIASRLMENQPEIQKAEVAGPGFCNITFTPDFWRQVIAAVERAGGAYGSSTSGQGKKALVEYVSANPTGPLHVGHGRGAAVGDSVARLLRHAGYAVSTEYYLNDAGRQMRTLGKSIWLRLLEAAGREIVFPDDCYQGQYIRDLAGELLAGDPGLADLAEAKAVEICQLYGQEKILEGIKTDLALFRCEHQRFFSEKSLVDNGGVQNALATLKNAGLSFEEDGALWFETKNLGDDRNRVLRKSDGSLTYFATDIAYHQDKFGRGHEWLIDVWGADHHGYIPRMKAAMAGMGLDPDKFSVLLVQLVNLLRGGKAVAMSTRAGEFVTLAEVVDEVGVDAARFMFLSRSCDSPLDFDLELARQRSLDNPVYYVQYGHARVCALLRRAADRGLVLPQVSDPALTGRLDSQEDLALLRQMAAFEDLISSAAQNLAPHHVSRYVMELAGKLHSYYAKYQILDSEDRELSLARLALLRAVGQVIHNGLFLLGVSSPEIM